MARLHAHIVAVCGAILFNSTAGRAMQLALPSTGTDAAGNVLAGGSADPHYTVFGPGIPVAGLAAVYSPQNIFPGWVPNDAHSAWIGWSDNSTTSPYGDYIFELQFSMIGFDPATASLSGSWAADQFGSIRLNGHSTGISLADGNWNGASAPNLTPFTISSGFTTGTNVLDFTVNEPDNFDGLRVRNLALTVNPAVLLSDYNDNGVVDAPDYVLWRDTLGSTSNLTADGDRNGKIDAGDYDIWRANFAAHLGNGSLAASVVPESPGLPLTLLVAAMIRRRHD